MYNNYLKPNEKLSLRNVIDRIKEETPPFWRKLRKLGVTLTILSGSILTLPQPDGIVIPASIITAAQYMAVAGITITTLSTLASEKR